MLEFNPLASSSAGCCYELKCAGHSLLLDCGISFKQIQIGTGFRVAYADGCLITHCHGDHVKAVKDLLKNAVDCYASRETWQAIGLPMSSDPRAHVIEAGSSLVVGGWTVLPFEAVHDVPGTLGFLIGSPEGHRGMYLTDSAYSKYKFEGLTHIWVEANFSSEILKENRNNGSVDRARASRTVRTHMSIERLITMLKANDLSSVREIWLLHLSGQNSDAESFKRQVQAATGKPTFVADETSRRVFS